MEYILTERQLKILTEKIGMLNEQEQRCDYENWQNGDGVTKPKITVTTDESGVKGVYEGPETGFCIQHAKGKTGDSIHQLAGVVSKTTAKYLKELYAQGTYVKPDLINIVMTKKDKYFYIFIPFISTTSDKAITGFNERGSWGGSESDTLKAYLADIQNNRKYGLIEKVQKVASGGNSADITETWVSFRDLETYPIIPTKKTVAQGGTGVKSTLQDYIGDYKFQDKDKGEIMGSVEEDNGKLKVSQGNRFFLLTRVEGDKFVGQTQASHDDDEAIPKICGQVDINLEATFQRNALNQVCAVKGVANGACKVGIFKFKDSRNMDATKNGVSCDAQPEQKPTVQTPAPEQKPTVQTPAPEQKPKVTTEKPKVLTPTSTDTTKPPGVKSNIKYIGDSVKNRRLVEDLDSTNQIIKKKYDAIFVGGLDDKKGYKNLGDQLEIFKSGYGNKYVKAFRYAVSLNDILTTLQSNPKIPIFLFSAGCNFADELMTSKLVDKNKLFLIEPFNKEKSLNPSVSDAIMKGLNPKNVFVHIGSRGRGDGFGGTSSSDAKSHWDALRSVGQKLSNI